VVKIIAAIDPGASGGIAFRSRDTHVLAFPMPATEGDILSIITMANRDAVQAGYERIAYIEEVSGFCGVGQPGSAMFKFGRYFGFLIGVFQTLGWRIELVKPQKWQKSFGLGTKALAGGKTAWKNKLKAAAQRMYPYLSATLKTCDALLLLEYARNQTN